VAQLQGIKHAPGKIQKRQIMRIVLLSDGTGNSASAIWRTNVRRMFEAVDLTGSAQCAFYDDGVGSSSFKPFALLAGAVGYGLKRNVIDLYKSVCRSYTGPADEIFGFGFSRGAFTIRVLTGLILNQGLVRTSSESELDRRAVQAYRAYRAEKFHSIHRIETIFRWLRDWLTRNDYLTATKPNNLKVTKVRFLGLWDTVAAYGLPVDEMTRGVSQWLWPLELPDRCLHPDVERACHALSLDDERTTFHPVLWDESAGQWSAPRDAQGNGFTKDERITQVWFVGVHGNVGGGYPDDTLAHIPLCWIMQEAQACGLLFKSKPLNALAGAEAIRDKDGRLYDSRSGLGGYYRYGPRKVYDFCHMRLSRRPADKVEIGLPKIHETVLRRIYNRPHAYAQIGLPLSYEVVTDSNEILAPANNRYEDPAEATARAANQERVWNLVWWRRIVYFFTVFTSLYIAIYPIAKPPDRALQYSTPLRPVSDLIGIIGSFLPGMFDVWVKAFQREPARFLTSLLVLGAFMILGSRLRRRINDEMLTIWRSKPAGRLPSDPVYKLRTHKWYTAAHWALKRHILPFVFAVLIAYLAWAYAARVLVTFLDAGGYFCRPSESTAVLGSQAAVARFDTAAICTGSGIVLEEGKRYRITIRQLGEWRDSDIPTNLGGIHVMDQPRSTRLLLIAALPMKRTMIRPWFLPIARIGSTGNDEEFLDANVEVSTSTHQEIIRARKDGELFFYVNDAILGVPGYWDYFYKNNRGQAEVTIQKL
jgi:uncharacterized protein (DUF2235 family)